MVTKVVVVISLLCLCFYFYGILISLLVIEENACKMTYMYEYPQFVKIHFDVKNEFPKYNLYAYSEGKLTENARNLHFNGAPVIFVPGNCGSYKQARSLASVALRKGIDNNWIQHIDYFTVDFNEEYSALYGGYLEDQTKFLGQSIKKVLNLYKQLPNKPNSLVIVAHSMGGKIAQSILLDTNITKLVSTIVMLATPVDKPVVNIDYYFETFYSNINSYWMQNKQISNVITNTTNSCHACNSMEENIEFNDSKNIYTLNNTLLITIGGGSRDLLVHSGLTTSKFSDVHATATSIPNVWLTTDHLCAVWCLQQIIVINRFLYSIIAPIQNHNLKNRGINFVDDKHTKLQMAYKYFTQKRINSIGSEISLSIDDSEWIEDSRRVFTELFKLGYNKTRYQMIRLSYMDNTQILNVEAINLATDDWVFGCVANEIHGYTRYCSNATSLSFHTRKVPSLRHDRVILTLNLHETLRQHPTWTHIILKLKPSMQPLRINIDIHNAQERELMITMPKWYSFKNINILSDTLLGSIAYTIKIPGMDESHQSVELVVKPTTCSKQKHHAIAKLCVPWTTGLDRYQHFTEQKNNVMYIYVSNTKPVGYNTTINPVTIQLNLDPYCRYSISIKNSFGMTLARIVQQFSTWLPAHIVAILLLALKHQISLSPNHETFKCGSVNSALVNCSPFFIITASKVFIKIVLWTKLLPNPDPFEHSLLISVLIHGAALSLLTLLTAFLRMVIFVNGKIAYNIISRFIQLSVPTMLGFIVPIIRNFPMSAAILLMSIGTASCGGLALVGAVLIYVIMLTKMYEQYLEENVYKTNKTTTIELTAVPEQLQEYNTKIEQTESIKDPLINEYTITNNEDKIIENDSDISESQNKLNKENELSIQGKNMESSEMLAEDAAISAELDKLLRETIEKQKQSTTNQMTESNTQREEYDSIHEGFTSINFHLTMFLLLLVLTLLNMPSVITWAQNFRYTGTLKNDPSLFPSLATLLAFLVMWQFPTPRNIEGYKAIGCFLYILAAVSILYCQDSVYRLNAIISIVFLLMAIHQVLAPTIKQEKKLQSLQEIEMNNRIEKLKNEIMLSK